MSLIPDYLSTVEDFLENDAFRAWVLEKRPEDRRYWQEWLARHPEKRDIYEQAVATFLVLQGKAVELDDPQIKDRTDEILDQLTDTQPVIKPLVNWHWGRWAAAAAVISFLVWWQFGKPIANQIAIARKQEAQPTARQEWKVIRNMTGQSMVVLLPDNSSVLLSTGSQLRFLKQSVSAVREVFLEGEGFFEVTKNPARPFIVYAPNLTTKVLGTSFQVHSFVKEATAYVKVKTGRVTVTPVDTPDRSVLLTVNEQLSLESKTDKMVKQEIVPTKERQPSVMNQNLVFDFTPVPDVFTQLESSYHMPIRYDGELLKNCTFTGQLNDTPFLEKIRLICLAIESTFDVVDNQVVIHSRGCH